MKNYPNLLKFSLLIALFVIGINVNASNSLNQNKFTFFNDANCLYSNILELAHGITHSNSNDKNGGGDKSMSIIKLAGVYNISGSLGDTTLIAFFQGATTGFDAGFDATKIINNDPNMPNIFSVINGSVYAAMNFYPELTPTIVTIPLGYSVSSSVQQKISATLIDDFPAGTIIYLEDVQQSVMQDLTVNPVYIFNMQASDPATGRFFIKFDATNSVGLNNNNNSENTFNAWSYNKKVYMTFYSESNKNAVVDIIDVYGRTILQPSTINSGNHQFDFSDKSSGYYFLRFNCDGKTTVKKIVVN